MRQRYYYTRAFPKVKPQKRFYQKRRRAEAPRPARQRISETMLSTAAPAISPAPIPTQNPVHILIFSHSFAA